MLVKLIPVPDYLQGVARMFTKMKARKCRRCKAEFQPKTEWQKFCGEKCRIRTKTVRRAEILRKARKIIERHEAEQGAA